ncbi:MAG: type II toxin-antitoxin system RelE/ParE family toxin [Dehalococcoidia bacterium]|nr:type II toxin-antitoxin system RelE/ParE family toxin [Dehalococcoidia bacterium]
MKWSLRYAAKAEKQLSKLDGGQSRIIVAWLLKNIEGCDNPRVFGSPLSVDHKGKWRYRIGSYRVLIEIQDNVLIVLALQVGHRKGVYSK